MKSLRFGIRSVPYLFAFITVVTYGLFLQETGFYWDDWPFAWIANFQGPQEFFHAFADVRPFLGPIFFVTTTLIPPVPLYWQIFALIIRFVSGLSIWFALYQVFPHFKRQALIVSLLFLIYPGYSQHWVAFTHINQEWIPLIFYLLSFGFTARALRRQHVGAITGHSQPVVLDTIYALLFLIAGVFPTEYFIGLEPIRFLFIWVIVAEKINDSRQGFIQSFKYWIPYLLIWLINALWLSYFYTIGSYGSYGVEVINEPLVTTRQLLPAFGDAIWKAGFYAWFQIIGLITNVVTGPSTWAALGLMVLVAIFFLFYFSRLEIPQVKTKSFAISAVVIGLVGILLGRVPSFAAGLPFTLQSSYDRFAISMMLGGSLFIVGLTELLISNAHTKNYIYVALIGMSCGQQFFNANIFRRDWSKQQEIYWQLTWRIPALKLNTTLLTNVLPVDYETDLSFTAPINWMYSPNNTRSHLDYAMIFSEIRLGAGTLPALEKDRPITVSIRNASFQGSTSQVVVLYMPASGCLRVLDPARGDQSTYGAQSSLIVDAIALSDPTNIISETGQGMATLPFLPEPVHTWCYFYAKAELAYQQGDWKQVIVYIDRAISLGYSPEDPFEWLAYLEAQAMTENIESAEKLSINLYTQKNGIRAGLCQVWQRVQTQLAEKDQNLEKVDKLLYKFQCP